MFLPTDIPFCTTDWIIYNGPPLCQIYILNLGLSTGKFQILQLVLLVLFGVVDEPLTFCTMAHFWVCVFFNDSVKFWYSQRCVVTTHLWYCGEEFLVSFLVLVFLYITQILPVIFPLYIFFIWNNVFLYQVHCNIIFHRRSFDSFLLKPWMEKLWVRIVSLGVCSTKFLSHSIYIIAGILLHHRATNQVWLKCYTLSAK